MDYVDQKLVDFLYERIFVQKLRSDHFLSMSPPNSVWNKHADEKKFLDSLVEEYKGYYRKKAGEMKEKLEKTKESDVSSYLTYDTEFYVNQYNDRVETINKYIVELDTHDFDTISNTKLNSVSTEIDTLFPLYMATPSLLGCL